MGKLICKFVVIRLVIYFRVNSSAQQTIFKASDRHFDLYSNPAVSFSKKGRLSTVIKNQVSL